MGAHGDQRTATMENNNKKQGDMQQNFLKRNSLMGDELLNFDPSQLEDEDWNVFDDDAPSDSLLPGSPSAAGGRAGGSSADKKATDSSSSKSASTNTAGAKSDAKDGASEPESAFDGTAGGLESIKRKQKKEAQVKKAESGPPPPSWHSEAADLPHRKAMVQEIAQLLFARKKDNPGQKWLDRLPLKARMLETQLYRNAASLEAYLDRTTLKARLGKLASAITSHFKDAVKGRRAGRSSTNSIRSVPDSFGASNFDPLSDVKNRRSSTGGLPSAPPATALRREQSESAVLQNITMPGPPVAKLRREQSEPVARGGIQTGAMNASNKAGVVGQQPNNNMQSFAGNNMGNNMPGMFQQGTNNGQMQQQYFANMRQQQPRNLNQMSAQGANGNQLMAAQAAMMGGANGMAMMNQMQQQQNAMNLNLMQQQRQGMGMQNMMAFQQQQQQNAMFMNGNLPGNTMNMMNNFSLPNVIPGAASNNTNFQQVNNSSLMARDNMSMPPPMNANTPGRKTSGNDEVNSLSPNSFHW